MFEANDLFFDAELAGFEPVAFASLPPPIPAAFAPASTAPIIAPVAAPLRTSVKVSVAALTKPLTGLATFFLQVLLF